MVQIQSLTSSSLFGHSGQKGGENFEGEHSLGLETLVHTGGLALFILTFMTVGLMFLLLLFKALVHCS